MPSVPGRPRCGLPLGHPLPASPLRFLVAQVAVAARLLLVALRVVGPWLAQGRRAAGAARRVLHHHRAPSSVQTLPALGCPGPPLFLGRHGAAAGLVFSRCSEAEEGQERTRDPRAASGQGAQGARRCGGRQGRLSVPGHHGEASLASHPRRTSLGGDAGPQTLLPSPAALQQGALWSGPRCREGKAMTKPRGPSPR